MQHGVRLGELDVAVVDDLDHVAARVPDSQRSRGADVLAAFAQRGAQRLLVGPQHPRRDGPEPPYARRDIRPAHEQILEKRLDVDLARRINRLLNEEGYTVRGVQKLLRERADPTILGIADMPAPPPAPERDSFSHDEPAGVDVFRLIQLRNRLLEALEG